MNKEKILQKLKNDEDYYGEFGNQFLSNSHVSKLIKDYEPFMEVSHGRFRKITLTKVKELVL